MKILIHIITLLLAASFLLLFSCSTEDKETAKEAAQNLLKSKSWKVNSVSVPPNTATDKSDWNNFSVTFTNTNMTTSGHATGANAVWPSGSYSLSEDGKKITRPDDVVMHINALTGDTFDLYFFVDGISVEPGRLMELSGDYRFNLN